MAVYDSCALLARLLREPRESAWLEFKQNNSSPEEIGEYISALSNSAILAGKERAFLVYGIQDGTRNRVGTTVVLNELKKGGENLTNWLTRLVEPRIMLDFLDFECGGQQFAIVCIEPSYDRPVRFHGVEYIRIGQNKKKLVDHPDHERSIWLATGRRRFEAAVALPNQSVERVFELLDADVYYQLTGEPQPQNQNEVLKRFVDQGFLIDDMQGQFDITNLAAILLAKDIREFRSISGKSVRIIKYVGTNKIRSELEQEGIKGYAAGFSGIVQFVMARVPTVERYVNGVRRMVPVYPETAVREVVANALIHQDFTVTGTGPVIEIYEDRIEVINGGNSLIKTDRLFDERRSRNEKLAETMRSFGLCEERGGGLDKTILEIEEARLPPPDFIASENSFRVVLFGPRPFNQMTRPEKIRACFQHCIIRWLSHDYMSNATLRERFGLEDEDYKVVWAIISEAMRLNKIVPAEVLQGRKNARYVPSWVAPIE